MILGHQLSRQLVVQGSRKLLCVRMASESKRHRHGDRDIPDHHRPLVTIPDARQILAADYKFDSEPVTATELLSYGDRNFLVKFRKKGCDEKFVLKILNPQDSTMTERIEKQSSVCSRLHGEGFSVPLVVKNKAGDQHQMKLFPVGNNARKQMCLVRLLTFVPGRSLGEVHQLCQLPPTLVGALLAQMHTALEDFSPEGLRVENKEMWSLENTEMLPSLFVPTQGKEKRRILKSCLRKFEKALQSKEKYMQKGVIHGDFHDNNLIVLDKGRSRDLAKVKCEDARLVLGIIDFAEISHSCLVFDLALLMCDRMVSCPDSLQTLQGEAAAHVLAGYLSSRQLGDADLSILSSAVAACLCVYIIYGEYEFHRQPDNAYVKQGSAEAWAQLQLLEGSCEGVLEECWSSVLAEKYALPPLPSHHTHSQSLSA